tara:strand:- start:239 stop:1819 length:1581 start_codon:yes stop_codon:yes gene_type:complete
MSATATYNPGTNILDISSNGLPSPVTFGSFPNLNNPNTVTEQDFDHDFTYRGGTFGIERTFDSNAFTQEGYAINITLSSADNTLLGDETTGMIRPGDNLLFKFSDGRHQMFVYNGTTFTSSNGYCWRSTDTNLQLVTSTSQYVSGTYTYYDQRNGRTETPLGAVGMVANGVVIFNPSAGLGGNPPAGFNWNAHYEYSPVDFGDDSCGGHPEQTGQYHYHDTHFIECWNNNSIMSTYNDYYGLSQYNGDSLRHPDGHSKVLGYSFDGFPVYGPYSYVEPFGVSSGIKTMRSSYQLKATETAGRPAYGNSLANPSAGSFIQDWEYNEGLGDLDYHNGRFCFTPEYPAGTYAYFLSVTEQGDPGYPYMIGVTTREVLDQPANNGAQAPAAPPSGGDGEAPPATLQIAAQPQNSTVNSGQTATFTISVSISPQDGPKTYQWYRSTDGGFAYSTLNGATSSTYQFTALSYMTGYKFKCVVAGPTGDTPAQNSPLESDVATLTVTGVGGSTDNTFDNTNATFDSTTSRFDQT